ncbi:hypothetical protein Lalb_Chr15g0077641 [Lupinus albus]|uniref:Uncharacterized protein n=1 Tax=Lupinus albus TaxID=3870 RepID=A0A6A4P5Y7_LUPAL|nr:hypothetical protein Lalb_Chr15g0077641 [Lupinus albus]
MESSIESSRGDLNTRTTNDNKTLATKNKTPNYFYYVPSPRRECLKVVTKSKKLFWWNDPEKKRKRRVAKYKVYASEGKFKHSIKKGFRWIKIKWIKIVTNL